MAPTPDEQIRFLVNFQRLLDEGLFVASYKFALFLALADISIELGDDSGAVLPISTSTIAEKFIQYYWRQAVPYPVADQSRILQQNTGKQAAIVNTIRDARATHGDSLAALMKNTRAWPGLVRAVADVVRVMPLWKLQTVGPERLDFLYANTGTGSSIELRPGVAFCFRKFHPLISDLVRGAWARYVRQQNLAVVGETTDLNEFLFGSERAALAAVRPVLLDIQQGRCFYCHGNLKAGATHVDHFVAWARYVRQQNLAVVGETTDLNEFLFGSERAALAAVRPVLLDIQQGRCFYCHGSLKAGATHVDHFVAWARYPVDLGHNFVLADERCNNKKRDRLPACEHLAAWTERNSRFGLQIGAALEERGLVSELGASCRVATWAYGQTEAAGGLTWLRADEMLPLGPRWRGLLP